jgi:aminotransferase
MLEKINPHVRHAGLSGLRELLITIQRNGYINLGPGICDLAPDPRVVEAAQRALNGGRHSYAPSDGIPELKEAIANRYAIYNRMRISSNNVLVTSGATGAFECVCKCFVQPGDEVIVFEPFYQYHIRQIQQFGGTPRYVRLHLPGWNFNPEELHKAVSHRTKLLVMANPNNPTGKVFSRDELETIGSICREAGVLVVCDEVYEYMTGRDALHISLASLPGMFENTLTLSSASKTFLVTGWRVGWLIGPSDVLGPLTVKSDETYLCAPTPLQYATAECLGFPEKFFQQIPLAFSRKRQIVCSALEAAGFIIHPANGAFYVMANYDRLNYGSDMEAVQRLMKDFGIAAVPGKEFFAGTSSTGMLRFCFAVTDELLETAFQRLTGKTAAVQLATVDL